MRKKKDLEAHHAPLPSLSADLGDGGCIFPLRHLLDALYLVLHMNAKYIHAEFVSKIKQNK